MAYDYKPAGRFFEDWKVGDTFDTAARTVTEADIAIFAGLSGDYNPLHTNEEYAKDTIHKTRIAHGALIVAIASGLRNQTRILEGTTIGLAGITEKFTAPTRAGDTIHCHCEILSTRETKKPDRGLVVYRCQTINQNDVVVVDQELTVMIRRKPQA
ncbi:MAG: dehydratase [Oscillospiraceae bacterium]|nr:dehydratase [Oscillospiraceae bacterium]